MYRTVEFWFYADREYVRVEITRDGRDDVSHFSREYEHPTKASLKRLMGVLGTMRSRRDRPENTELSFWTNGSAASTEVSIHGRLEPSPAERLGKEVVDSFMQDVEEGAGPHEVVTNFFENLFKGPPLSDL